MCIRDSELVARIRAVLRRAKPTRAADEVPEVLSVGDVDLDPATRSVQRCLLYTSRCV